ncbi:MAG TPA: Rid family hydrolase [Acidimicrobiales bacterium]
MTAIATIEHINPAGLISNPAFSQVVTVAGPGRTVHVGGQNAVTAAGELIGEGDVGAQADQVFANLRAALAAAGAELHHVVKWTIYVVDGHDIVPGFAAYQRAWGDRPDPPVITVAKVAGLAHPAALVEVEATAVVPLDAGA